jgi:hypothetical protein
VWPFSARGDKCDKCDKGHVGKGQGSGLARRLLSGVFARRAGRRGTLGPHLVFHACQCSPFSIVLSDQQASPCQCSPVLYCSFRPTGQSSPIPTYPSLVLSVPRPWSQILRRPGVPHIPDSVCLLLKTPVQAICKHIKFK